MAKVKTGWRRYMSANYHHSLVWIIMHVLDILLRPGLTLKEMREASERLKSVADQLETIGTRRRS